MKKWIFIGVGGVLAIGLAVGATLFMTGAFSESEPEIGAAASDAPQPIKEIHYHYVHPEFIVNFSSMSRPRSLMMEIAVASTDESIFTVLETHSPELRNDVLILLAEQDGKELKTTQGKNLLRLRVKESIEELLEKHGKIHEIEDIYFTRFVMQ